MTNESSVEFAGTIGRVLAVKDRGRTIFLQLRNDQVAKITFGADAGLKRGQVLIFDNSGNFVLAPKGAWTKENQISVIRKILEDEILVEVGVGFRKLPVPVGIDLAAGNTVEWNEVDGVLSVVSDGPIRYRDTDIDDEYELAQFKVEKTDSSPTFDDFGGYEDVVARARELIRTQLDMREELTEIGARPIKGVLFSGPPGTGKTLLAQIIAFESGASFFHISGPSIVSKYVGDSEQLLRRIFEAAALADSAIIFFDEIDSVAGRRDANSHEASVRLVAQLLTLMDGSADQGGNVVVVAATNRVEEIDPALRRPGRFDWEIEFGMPTAQDRHEILTKSSEQLSAEPDLPLEAAVDLSEGWSAAQLTSVWSEAALICASDGRTVIDEEDFAAAFQLVERRIRGGN